jgi:2-polyprenyl-3-methyl-5-hydroxy-6-metoxy-1,4-benzoquinol methylase
VVTSSAIIIDRFWCSLRCNSRLSNITIYIYYFLNNMFTSKFKIKDGIYQFGKFTKKTKSVTDFYKDHPFPNYNDNDDKFTINSKGKKNILAFEMKELIGFNKNILEVGSGTCQLSNFFAIGTNNNVYALDPTIESLQAGKKFAKKNNVKNIKFINSDIFEENFQNSFFDFVWCNGVLHHTEDPYQGFVKCVNLLKKDGYIVIGLYNKLGRIRTYFRKFIYKFLGLKILKFFDPILRNQMKNSPQSIDAWVKDQYCHPLESGHTIDEVLDWFSKNNIKVISSIPNITNVEVNELRFSQNKINTSTIVKNKYERIFEQIFMIFNSYGDDGGLFVLVGKKINDNN